MADSKKTKRQAASNRARNSEIMANMVAPPPPVAPTLVAPMPTADDMVAVNDWLTNYTTQLEDIDNSIAGLESDTKYAKAKNDQQATESRSASDDAMAARGIFRSSLRDAATYDIEATRSLANTYLDSKLNEAITAGTTRKGTLAAAKTAFETGMQAKYAENAAPINAALNEGYATAMANYKPPPAIRARVGGTATPGRPVVVGSKSQPTVTPGRPTATGLGSSPPTTLRPPAPAKPKKPKKPR